MTKIIKALILSRRQQRRGHYEQVRFVPEPPPGFVRRSDPNFYFLARKF